MPGSARVCGNCGAGLSAGDNFCPQCGTKTGVTDREPETGGAPATCEVCGHNNVHAGAYCEACGAKLPGRSVSPEPARTAKRTSQKKAPSPKSSMPKPELWHYVVGVVVLGIIGVFVYLEYGREYAPVSTQQMPPMQFPAAQTPSTPPSKEILEAIDRLQNTVKENPNDVGAKLLLANALHDGAMHDGRLFPRAIEAYKAYLKEKPGDPNARVDLGICYFELGKIDTTHSSRLFSAAIDEMKTAVKENPNHQPGAFNLAIVYLYSGNLKESNRWLQRAVEVNPESDLGKRAKAILEQHNQAG